MPLLIQPYDALSPFATAAVVFGLGVLGLGGLLVVAVVRWRAFRLRAMAAEMVASAGTSLRPGLTILNGVVEVGEDPTEPDGELEGGLDGAEEPEPGTQVIEHQAIAIAMTIRERRDQRRGGAGYTFWVEEERSVAVRPFYLVLPQGTRVRVEPDEHVLVVDALETKEAGLVEGERERWALLENGDRVSVSGVLSGSEPQVRGAGYRASGEAEAMRLVPPPRGERMLVSSEPPPERYVRRATLHRAWAWRFVVALTVFHCVVFGAFHRSLLFGTATDAVILETGERAVTGARYRGTGGMTHEINAVTVRHPETGREVTLETSVDLHGENGRRVMVRYVPGTTLISLGEYPTERFLACVLAGAAVLLLGIVYVVHARRSLLWYERRRVVEIEERDTRP
jgi:hypothetical protein